MSDFEIRTTCVGCDKLAGIDWTRYDAPDFFLVCEAPDVSQAVLLLVKLQELNLYEHLPSQLANAKS